MNHSWNLREQAIRIATAITALAFVALTVYARMGYYLPGEQDLLGLIVSHRILALNQPALILSMVGSINIILPLWALVMLLLLWRRSGAALFSLLPVPLAYLLYSLVKTLVARPEPTPPLFPRLYDLSLGYYFEGLARQQLQHLPAQGVSLPAVTPPVTAQVVTRIMESGYVSGHALLALLFYGTLAWWLAKSASPNIMRAASCLACGLVALLVGVARLYMGVHFPSDVVGAWLLAAILLVLDIKVIPALGFRLMGRIRGGWALVQSD